MALPSFTYNSSDLVSEVPTGKSGGDECSRFDTELRTRWDDAEEKGYFRYQVKDLLTKIIEGPHGFVAQLNVKRATDRRKPQEIRSTKQPFKPEEFNFNKVRPHEILMVLNREDESESTSSPSQNGTSSVPSGTNGDVDLIQHERREGGVYIIINISPLEYGNVLLVPSPKLCQPQVATLEMIQAGVEVILLSSSRALRVGYNSLCAFASVNHLHMHAYYVNHRLPTERWPTQEVVAGGFHETVGWPAQAFTMQLRRSNYMEVIRDFYKIVKLLQDKDIAHNIFFTRGLTLGPNPQEDGQTVRLILWPRVSSYGVKANDAFNGACCELAGHLPVKREERYKTLQDDQCKQVLQDESLPPQEYANLKADVKKLF